MYQFTPEKKAAMIKLFKSLPVNKRRMEFLEDMVEFYTKDNRAVKQSSSPHVAHSLACVYHSTSKSPGCAIGRWLEQSETCNLLHNGSIVSFLKADNVIPDWMKEMGIDFLVDCQGFHDNEIFWNEEDAGCNELKQDAIDNMIHRINNFLYV